MRFGLDGSRKAAGRGGARGLDAMAHRELQPLATLTAEAATAGLMAQVPSGAARAERLIAYTALLREIARRSGLVETLTRAASAAARAVREAGDDRLLKAAALYELAETHRLGLVLFAEREAQDDALTQVEEALALAPPVLTAARLQTLRARLSASAALAKGERAAGIAAAESLEVSLKVLITLRAPVTEIAALAADRAELMIGLGLIVADRTLLSVAEAELGEWADRLDPDREPLTWTRVQTLRGSALLGLGEMCGDAASIAEAVVALKAAQAALPLHHSPLDEARAGHALGLALQAMGEACEEEALFDRAVKAFSPALEALDRTPALPYRALVAHDGAVCLARRAERRGDLEALEQAEAAFREALATRSAAADPLAWAVTQVALARIYEAQAGLRPDTGERADAAFALASALEVFAERGMRSLTAATLSSLDRLRERV